MFLGTKFLVLIGFIRERIWSTFSRELVKRMCERSAEVTSKPQQTSKRFKRWFGPDPYPWYVLFLVMGVFGAMGAYLSVDLARLAMSNSELIREHGKQALMEGGLEQAFFLAVRAGLILFSYLGFRALEDELVQRWRRYFH